MKSFSPILVLALVALLALVISTPTALAVPSNHAMSAKGRPPLPSARMDSLAVDDLGNAEIQVTPAADRTVVWTQTVEAAKISPKSTNVKWVRVRFDMAKTQLAEGQGDGHGIDLPGEVLRLSSLDGKLVQHHNARTLKEWSGYSAFFNGDALKVELLADPANPQPRQAAVVFKSLQVNSQGLGGTAPIDIPPPTSLCSANDERTPSQDMRQGRLYPVGCTGWSFSKTPSGGKGCMLTAGHCFDGFDVTQIVLQLNMPATIASPAPKGGRPVTIVQHPHPDFQFAVDPASVQFLINNDPSVATNQDWGYYGTFANPNTGKTVQATADGKAWDLAPVLDSTVARVGTTLRITGNGVVDKSDRLDRSLTQQTATGALSVLPDGFHAEYRVDTTGGNSGSAITVDGTNTAIGIHTNGGCSPSSGTSTNTGSLLAQKGLVAALASPKGVCA